MGRQPALMFSPVGGLFVRVLHHLKPTIQLPVRCCGWLFLSLPMLGAPVGIKAVTEPPPGFG